MLRAAAAFFGCARKPPIVEDEIPLLDFSSTVSIDDAWVMMNAWSVERYFSLCHVPAARSDTSLIEACTKYFEVFPEQGFVGGISVDRRSAYDARFATAVARKMIACYCKMDDALQPSALFDIIIVGAYVYASACNEALTRSSLATLRTLKECCGFSNLTFIGDNIGAEARFVMAHILTIGYKCLIEQSWPFNGDLVNCSSVFQQAMPANRFDRYQLNREGEIDPVMHENARKLELRDESLGANFVGEPVIELASRRESLLDHYVDIQSFFSQMNIAASRFKHGNFASCLYYGETELIKKIGSVTIPRP